MYFRYRQALAVIGFYLLGSIALSATGSRLQYFELANHGSLVLNILESWQVRVKQPRWDLPPTIQLSQSSGEKFVVLITPLWKMAGAPDDFASAPKLRSIVEKSKTAIAQQAVEKDIEVKPLGGKNTGYYFVATDKAPKPDEYKYLIQGAASIGELLTTFTILSNDKNAESNTLALDIIRTAVHRMEQDSMKNLQIDDVLIKPVKIADLCRTIDGQYPVSIQAGMHYEMVGGKKYVGVAPQNKQFQSFTCNGEKSTIYYYQYASRREVDKMLGFVKALIWGESGRSRVHPEIITTTGNILIVISSKKPGYFARLIDRK